MTSADATILMQNALIWTAADVPDLELAAAQIGSMCGPHERVATLRDRWRSPARLTQGRPGQSTPVTVPAG